MNTYQFNALNNSLIKELAELFIERQKEEITFFPFLEGALLKKEDVESRFEAMFRDEKVIGLGAFKKDEMIAFLLGEVHIHHKENYIRVPYHGIALKKGESLELLRMLYQKLSTEWIKEECFHHQVYLPLGDANYEKAFTHLSFAKEQIYALLDMNDYHPFHCQTDIKIRIANQQDGDVMEHMADIIFKYQNQAPVFALAYPELVKTIRNGYRNSVSEEQNTILIAERNQKALGFQLYEPSEQSLMIPKKCIDLTIAGTEEASRGQGIGKALMDYGWQLMKQKGYQFMYADWRVANLASSTFWPSCGFVPYVCRMVRTINPEIVWANFEHPENQR